MANDNQNQNQPQTQKSASDVQADKLERLAFQLFSERSGRGVMKRGAETLAVKCFQDAEGFLAIANRIRSGEQVQRKKVGPQLAEVCAPNLKRTHPINMVSQRF